VRNALLSVSDKTDLVAFARRLTRHGVRLISTGGTARALREADLDVTDVSDVTGHPEIMDGRVKTLHPKIHGGLLAVRDNPDHLQALADHGIAPIDLVCVNLYPFEQTVAGPDVSEADAIEQIDIGGPCMIRAAAKNHRDVAVLTHPGQYDAVGNDLDAHDGATTLTLRRELAGAAFARTAAYDAAITAWLTRRHGAASPRKA
jgi:phosphoribosylaminoimidazolecarboxamide formyltransferase/IMP cyclohydrolase